MAFKPENLLKCAKIEPSIFIWLCLQYLSHALLGVLSFEQPGISVDHTGN